jgi:squalene-associated FAD-dependent desaturase
LSAAQVAVLGAGYAGIAAAVELARHGARVTLYEANRTAGGRARRVEYRDTTLDNGQHLLLGAYRETLRLMGELGVPEHAVRRIPLALHYPGMLSFMAPRWPAPLHLVWALLRARGLRSGDKWAALRFCAALRGGEGAAREAETVRALLERHGQTARLCSLVWEPLCIAALNTPPDFADARVFARVLHDALLRRRSDSDLLIPATDLSALLPDAALAWLAAQGAKIRLGERANAVRRGPSRWHVDAAPGSDEFDAVVCATAPFEAAGLLAGIDALRSLSDRLRAIPHEPITTVYLQFDCAVRLPFPMVGVAGGSAQWLFDREALGGTVGLVAAVISSSRTEVAEGQESLIAQVRDEIVALAGPLGRLRWAKVITEKRATFACVPGVFRPAVLTDAPGLVLAGDYTHGPYPATLEAAVQSGLRAARALLDGHRSR